MSKDTLTLPGASRTRTESRTTTRATRTPFGVPRQKLLAPAIPGFVLRWINDTNFSGAERIPGALEGGYEFVMREEVPEFGTAEVSPGNSNQGTKVSRVVGVRSDGQPLVAYLMKIRKEWYDEDQATKQERVDQIDQAINRGDVNKTAGDKRYVKQISVT